MSESTTGAGAGRAESSGTSTWGPDGYETDCADSIDEAYVRTPAAFVALLEADVDCTNEAEDQSGFDVRGAFVVTPAGFAQVAIWRTHMEPASGAWSIDWTYVYAGPVVLVVYDAQVGETRYCYTAESVTGAFEQRDAAVCDAAKAAGDAAFTSVA